MARAGMLGFFGAGGPRPPTRSSKPCASCATELAGRPNWGVNLIHSPNEPALEDRVADLLLRRGVPRVSASAFMELTPAVVRCAGHRAPQGRRTGAIVRRTRSSPRSPGPRSRPAFLSPAPPDLLRPRRNGAAHRGGGRAGRTGAGGRGHHRRGRQRGPHRQPAARRAAPDDPAPARRARTPQHGYTRAIRVGAAGGLGTPAARGRRVRAGRGLRRRPARSTRSRVEAGLSDDAKAMLAEADIADVIMAPAADMFELGVKVQVLRRGTMFAPRAGRLYEAYRGPRRPWRRMPAAARAHARTGGAPAPRSTRSGRETQALLAAARPRRDRPAPSATRSTGWRWSSAGTWACPAAGRSPGSRAAGRLPDLVRAGDGRVQRVGRGSFLADPGRAVGGADRAQPARRRRRGHPRAPAAHVRRAGAGRRVRLHPAPPR